jgi:hypothetical protein
LHPIHDFGKYTFPTVVDGYDVAATFRPDEFFLGRSESLQRELTDGGRHPGIFARKNDERWCGHRAKSFSRATHDAQQLEQCAPCNRTVRQTPFPLDLVVN